MLYLYHCAIILHSIGIILACAAFYRVACCQFLRVYRVACCFVVLLCLHVSKLVYKRLFRDSRQLQNVRLYKYHDNIKMHSGRVSLRLVAFYRLACCLAFADCVRLAQCCRVWSCQLVSLSAGVACFGSLQAVADSVGVLTV